MMPILTTEGRQEVEAILNTSLFFAKKSGTVASPLTILENSIGVVLSNDLKHHHIMFNQSINQSFLLVHNRFKYSLCLHGIYIIISLIGIDSSSIYVPVHRD